VATLGGAMHWHQSTVVHLLKSSAAIGTMTPKTFERERGRDGKVSVRRAALEPVEGYWPAIVERDVFEAVQAMREGTVKPLRGRHANEGVVRNVLGGVAVCPACGGRMTRIVKSGGGRPYLVCQRAKAKAGCVYRMVRLENVEKALRDNAAWLIATAPERKPSNNSSDSRATEGQPDGSLSDGSISLTVRLSRLEQALSATEDGLEVLLDELTRGPSAAVSERVRETEAVMGEMRAERDEIEARIAMTLGPMVEQRLEKLRAAIETWDVAAANVVLRQCVSGVVVDYRTGQLVFQWLHGGESSVMFAWPDEAVSPSRDGLGQRKGFARETDTTDTRPEPPQE
jgi:Recombinase zinc beta ribbon domain/Recombinase